MAKFNWQNLDSQQQIVDADGRPTPYFLSFLQAAISNGEETEEGLDDLVPQTRVLTAGTGLDGGGDLTQDRTFDLDASIDLLTDVDTSTTPPTVGQLLQWDGTNWVPYTLAGAGFSGARIYKATGISITTSATTVINSWDSEDYDIGGWWSSGTPDSFVIPSGVTKVNVNFNMFRAANLTGQFIGQIAVYSAANALLGTVAVNEIDTTGGDSMSVTAIGINVTPGMRIKARYFIETAGNLDAGLYGTSFSIQAVG